MKKPAQSPCVQLLTPAETGGRLRCSDDSVYRLVALGELPAVDIAPPGSKRSKTRIREDDLQRYIDKQTRKAAGDAAAT